MVCDDDRVYAFDRQPQYYPRTSALEYHVYAADKQPEIVGGKQTAVQAKARRNRPAPSRPAYAWSYQTPLLGRGLVLADRTLFVSGPPDLVDQESSLANWDDPDSQQNLADQAAALAGRRGAVLIAVSADEGRQLAAYQLPSPPVFDGLVAADEHLYLASLDGRVSCLGREGRPLKPAPDMRLTDRPEPIAAGGSAALSLTSSHPDFQHLAKVRVTACDLGYRVQTPSGSVGLAVRKLAEPVVGQTTFKLRLSMVPNNASERPPGNGFLVFGDGPDDAKLIKCGLRNAGQQGMIVQGPLLEGDSTGRPVVCRTNEEIELVVHVDLDVQTVQLDLLGQSITADLPRPLREISYLGYAVHSVACEFGPIQMMDN
jgi:hypothetical protein